MLCSWFVFQSGICPVVGFWWCMCKLGDLSLLWRQYLYCALCSLGTEFSANQNEACISTAKYKFIIFLETVLKLSILRTK